MKLWADRAHADEAKANAEARAIPISVRGFELVEKVPGRTPRLGDIHLFNWGSILSQGALAGDIPGLFVGATRLVQAISHALFTADIERARPEHVRVRKIRNSRPPTTSCRATSASGTL